MPKIDKVVYTNELNEIRTILKLVMFLNKYFNIVIDTNNTFNDMITKYPDIYNSIETINAEILRLDNTIDNHLSNYNELVNNVESNTNNINILQNRVDAQTRNIASLETKSNEQAQGISELQTKSNEQAQNIRVLQSDMLANAQDISEVQTQSNEQAQDISTLRNDVSGKLDKTGGTLTGNLNIGQYSLQGTSNGAIKDLINFGSNGALNLGSNDRVTNINSFGRPKWNNKLIATMDDVFPKNYYLVGYSNFEGNASFFVVIPSNVEVGAIYDTFGTNFVPILNGIFTFNNNEYTVVGIKAIDINNISITYVTGFDVLSKIIDFTNGDTSIGLLDY